jgi:hypothetical protein
MAANANVSRDSRQHLAEPKYPFFSEESARLKSLDNWVLAKKYRFKESRILAKAGFFFNGLGKVHIMLRDLLTQKCVD